MFGIDSDVYSMRNNSAADWRLLADHAWRHWHNESWSKETAMLRFIDENFLDPGESFVCPDDLKYIHEKTREKTREFDEEGSSNLNNTANGIFIFPGSILTNYFAACSLRTDYKHYGFPLHIIFLRAIQGVVQEYSFLLRRRYHLKENIIRSCLRPLCDQDSSRLFMSSLYTGDYCRAFRDYIANNATANDALIFRGENMFLHNKAIHI